MNFNTFSQRLDQLIQPPRVQQLAIEQGWQKRRGKISAWEFLFSVVGQGSALDLTLNAQASTFTQPVTRQAVDQRYNPAAVAYFEAAVGQCLASTLAWRSDSVMTRKVQEHFGAIRLFDSTHCPCSDGLARLFPDCGGVAGQAGLKLLLSYNYATGQLQPLRLLPAKCSDQSLAGVVAQAVGPGELGICDKGFHHAAPLRELAQRGGFYLLPWSHGLRVWQLNPAGQPTAPIEVAQTLAASSAAVMEWEAVALGQTEKSRLAPVRLVAFRLQEQSASRHRAVLRQNCRKQGRTVTAAALELAGWLILLTNAPAQRLPTAAIGYLYRARWQIELVFKQFKSVLRLDVLVSDNPCRVQCELWARLLSALLTFAWYQHTNILSLAQYDCEMSFAKVAKLLQQQGYTLTRTLFAGRERLHSEWRHVWGLLLKLARKERQPSRPTTWENLCEHWLVPTAT